MKNGVEEYRCAPLMLLIQSIETSHPLPYIETIVCFFEAKHFRKTWLQNKIAIV